MAQYSLEEGTTGYDNFVNDLADALMEWDSTPTPMENIDWNKTLKELYAEQVEIACLPIIQKLVREVANAK